MVFQVDRLILAVAAAQPNVVVVLCNGAPVEMPWVDDVRSVLEMYLGGQAIAEINRRDIAEAPRDVPRLAGGG